jgi:hypothetical protein
MPQIEYRSEISGLQVRLRLIYCNDISGLGRSASSVGPNAHGRHVITKPLRRSKSQLPGDNGHVYFIYICIKKLPLVLLLPPTVVC